MLNPNESKVIPMPDFSKMNHAQRQAVTHGEGPLLLLAGPGSGKTFTITNRILFLLSQGVSPGEILVITYTKDAAVSMQERFSRMMSPHTYAVNFGTFHSVFYQILRESNVIKSKKILSDSEKKNLLLPILYQLSQPGEDVTLFREEAVKVLAAISYYKNTNTMTEAVNKCPEQWKTHFEKIYEEYRLSVKQLGRVDFDDMLYECRDLLAQRESVRTVWQKKFQHILIDEFQDINPIQYEIIKLLAGKTKNIFAVGDDDQSIYGFRGSTPDCMNRFLEDFQAKQLLLNMNYRSTPEIVNASLLVIGENRNRFEKQLLSAESSNQGVVLQPFENGKAQYEYLMGQLKALQTANMGESLAVLFRTNQYMQTFAVYLQQAQLPFEMKEKQVSIYENVVIRDVMAYLQLAKGLGSREQFLQIVNKPSRYIRREAVFVKDGRPDFTAMAAYYEKPWVEERERVRFLDEIRCLERHFESLVKLSLPSAIIYIRKAFGYEEYLRKQAAQSDKLEEWSRLLDWLKEDGARFRDLKEWLDFQQVYKERLQEKTENRNFGRNACRRLNGDSGKNMLPIQLMTVHAAKGLEFDHVWIPDCNERVFPYGIMPDEKCVEEERRIFYVAMTRAKKSLELLYLTGTRERPRQPSAFLNPLYSSSSIISSNSQLSKYSSKASATFSYSSSSAIYSSTGSSLGSSGFSL